MKIFKTLISLILITSLTVTSQAAESTNEQVPITVVAEPTTFNVTVSTGLPVWLSADGEVTTSDNILIQNNSIGPVIVKSVSVDSLNGWELGEYTHPFKSDKVDTKSFGFELFDNEVSLDGSCDIQPIRIDGKGSIKVPYNAKVSPQSSAIEQDIAQAVFVVGWDTVDASIEISPNTPTSIKPSEEQIISLTFENVQADNSEVTWTSSDETIATVSPYTPEVNTLNLVSGTKHCKVTGISPGVATITATLSNGDSKSLDVTIKDISKLVFISPPTKTEYTWGEDFDPSGLEVGIKYTDGSIEKTDDYYWEYRNPAQEYKYTETSLNELKGLGNDTSKLYFYNTADNYATVRLYLSHNKSDASEEPYRLFLDLRVNDPIKVGTKYTSGNYEYSYKQTYIRGTWSNNTAFNEYWGVRVINNNQTVYSQPLTSIQGRPVTTYQWLFHGYPNQTLTLKNWSNTSNIINMCYMFGSCKAETINGLEKLDVSNVTNMQGIFSSSDVKTLDLSMWKTDSLTHMPYSFSGAKATSINLNGWNTSKVTNFDMVFFNISNAKTIDIRTFDISNADSKTSIFDSTTTTVYAKDNATKESLSEAECSSNNITFVVK